MSGNAKDAIIKALVLAAMRRWNCEKQNCQSVAAFIGIGLLDAGLTNFTHCTGTVNPKGQEAISHNWIELDKLALDPTWLQFPKGTRRPKKVSRANPTAMLQRLLALSESRYHEMEWEIQQAAKRHLCLATGETYKFTKAK